MNPPKFDRVEDMTTMTYLDEANVYNNLLRRYQTDYMYTKSGMFTVAINPYRDLHIYSKDMVNAYDQTPETEHPPHIYNVICFVG